MVGYLRKLVTSASGHTVVIDYFPYSFGTKLINEFGADYGPRSLKALYVWLGSKIAERLLCEDT